MAEDFTGNVALVSVDSKMLVYAMAIFKQVGD